MSRFRHLLLVLTFTLQLLHSYALFEDQIGKFDWKKEFIGKVNNVQFDNLVSVSSYAYFSSEQNVLGCIEMKQGEIFKRKVISEQDGKIKSLLYSQDGLIVITEKGIARIWHPKLSDLQWESDYSESISHNSDFTVLESVLIHQHYTKSNLLVVLSSYGLHKAEVSRYQSNPSRIVSAPLEFEQMLPDSHNQLFVDSAKQQILHLSFGSSNRLSVCIHDTKDMELISHRFLDVTWLDSIATTAVLESQVFVFTGSETTSFYIIDLQSGNEIATVDYSTLDISYPVHKLIVNNNKDVNTHGTVFAAWSDDNQISLISYQDKSLKNIWSKKFDSIIDVQIEKVGFETCLFITSKQDRKVVITAVDIKAGVEKPELEIKYLMPAKMGEVRKVYIEIFLRRKTPFGFRALLQGEDDSITLVESPNRAIWTREESLASLSDVLMLDLPLSAADVEIDAEFDANLSKQIAISIFEMFIKRVKVQYQQVTSWAKQVWSDLNSLSSTQEQTTDPLIQVAGFTRDPFCLHKMIVSASKSGTVFGLDSINGDIIWKNYHPSLKEKKIRIFLLRSTAHYPNPPKAVILGLSPSQQPVVFEFNPITGSFTDLSNIYNDMKSRVMQAYLLPYSDEDHLRPLVMISEDLQIRLLPDSISHESLNRHQLYFYDVDKRSGSISGYKLGASGKAKYIWNFVVPKTHRIIAFAGKYQMEKIDSMGRPLANRSVNFKYLNPNVGAVVSESLDTNMEQSSLLLHVFDGITGKIIHSHIHKRSGGPVHIVNSENWIIYSYRHLKNRRNEIMSLEFYEGEKQVNGTVFSSYQNRPLPTVYQQAYIMPAYVSAIGLSRTEKSITSRQLMFGLRSGSVIGLLRRFFDPRRPLHPKEQHREEGLIPYMPEVPMANELMLSYNLTIQKIRNIYTSPAALESTSLVFVAGLDLFFTRTQPSKMFDVLKDDFDHGFIATVLIGMLVVVFITRRLAQMKQLNKAWK